MVLWRSGAAVLALAMTVAAADWPRFRGVNGAGVGVATRALPDEIAPGKNVLWKVPLPPGHSSPVLFGDRIYLTAAEIGKPADAGHDKIVDEGGKLFTYCLRRKDGTLLWRREAPRPRGPAWSGIRGRTRPRPGARWPMPTASMYFLATMV
ncbi:MAG: hypothetical protein FJW31_14635 [Acidobacteria bacterium]|nr:hypothetical protein [Acidobacteriota bacterium]